MMCKLLDICEFVKGKVAVSNLTKTNYISTENMLPNRGGIVEATTLPSVDTTQTYSKGDILVSNIRPYFKKIWFATTSGGCSNDVLVFRAKKEVNPFYLYYILSDDRFFNYATATSKGTKMPRGDKIAIMNYEIEKHSRSEQDVIASILRPIDEKIALNREINNNLEQQTQLLLSSWLSNNQAEADEVTLGDVCSKVTDGSHYSPKDDITSTIPMLSVKDMGTYDFDLGSCKHISEEDYAQMVANDCVPLVNDILVAKDGSYLKEIFICNERRKLAILSSIAIFRPNLEKIYPEILLAFLKTPSVLREVKENYVSGSALPRIVLKDFKKLRFKLPHIAKQHELANILSSIREQIAVNVKQIGNLTALRDTLLPRLMSGELDVSDVEI